MSVTSGSGHSGVNPHLHTTTASANTVQDQAVHQVADHIEGMAARLRTVDMRTLADQATDLAKRNPFLFIGGAAVAGFAAARFLKARDPEAAQPNMPEKAEWPDV